MVFEETSFYQSIIPIYKDCFEKFQLCEIWIGKDGEDKLKFSTKKAIESLMVRYDFKTIMDSEEIFYRNPIKGFYLPLGEKIIDTELSRFEDKYNISPSDKSRAKIKFEIRNRTWINRNDFSEHKTPEWINLRNCWLNILTKEVYYHNVDQRSIFESNKDMSLEEAKEIYDKTRKFEENHFFLSYHDIDYQPNIICNNFEELLCSLLKDVEDQSTIWEWFGYSLYPKVPIKKACLMYGPKDSGKSTILNILWEFVGDDNCTAVTLHDFYRDNFTLAQLLNKKANIQSDLSSKQLRDGSYFKKLVGRDKITTRFPYAKNSITFTNHAKVFISQNKLFKPGEDEDLDSFITKFNLIEFPETIEPEKQIPEEILMKKVANDCELSGILNKALDGLHRLLENKKFTNEYKIENYKSTWMKLSNSHEWFFTEVVRINENGKSIEKKTLYEDYVQICVENRYPIEKRREFVMLGNELGFSARRASEKGLRKEYYDDIEYINGYSSEVTEKQDSKPKQTKLEFKGRYESLRDTIENLLIIHEEGLSFSEIQKEMYDNKFTRDEVSKIFLQMKEDGQIYEPDEDKWKLNR